MKFFLTTLFISSLSLNAFALGPKTNEIQEQTVEMGFEKCEHLEEASLPQDPNAAMSAITDCLAPPIESSEKKVVAK